MRLLMHSEPAGPRVLFITAFKIADEGLRARMNHAVRLHVPLRDESHLAHGALERPLASVAPDVRLQITRLVELLQAARERAHKHLGFDFWPLDKLDIYSGRKEGRKEGSMNA